MADIRDMLQNNQDPTPIDHRLIVDSATDIAYQAKMEKKRKKERLEFFKAEKKKFEAWRRDTTRSELFNSIYKKKDKEFPKFVVVEVFCTVEESKSNLILQEDPEKGVSDLALKLYPIVKDLSTGKIYTIADEYCRETPNPEYKEWLEKASGSPRFREKFKEPPHLIYPLEMLWRDARFVLNKFNPEITPAAYYTFRISENQLGEELL